MNWNPVVLALLFNATSDELIGYREASLWDEKVQRLEFKRAVQAIAFKVG